MQRAARGHEFVDHTADLGLRAWGPDLGAAFAEAARALFEYMLDLSQARPVGEVIVQLEAETVERLLFVFLDELLYRHQTDLVAFSAFDVTVALAPGKARLRARVAGEALDAARHGHVHEVKAMTFHDLRVDAGPPAEVYILVDI